MIEKNYNIFSNKQIDRIVTFDDGWKQITVGDQRFYSKSVLGTNSILEDQYFPSVTYILSCYPKGKWFEDWLKEQGTNANIIAAEAAEKGSNVHRAVEQMFRGYEPIWIDDSGNANYSFEEWKMILKFADFWNTYKPKLIKSEFHIFSLKHKFAGTIDLVIELFNKLWILDIKTSKVLNISYDLQVASYAVAWNEHFDRKIDSTGILWLNSNTRKPDKNGKNIQGKGWQLKESEKSYEENFQIFEKVYDIFKIEYPNAKPVTSQYPNKIKLILD